MHIQPDLTVSVIEPSYTADTNSSSPEQASERDERASKESTYSFLYDMNCSVRLFKGSCQPTHSLFLSKASLNLARV